MNSGQLTSRPPRRKNGEKESPVLLVQNFFTAQKNSLRAEGIPRRRQKRKSLPIPQRGIGRLRSLPQDSFLEELGRMNVPGQVSWLSGHHRILSLPLLRRAEQWPATMPGRMRLAVHSGGTAADFNGLTFYPLFEWGIAGTCVVTLPTTLGN
jgi:hypothetical protein